MPKRKRRQTSRAERRLQARDLSHLSLRRMAMVGAAGLGLALVAYLILSRIPSATSALTGATAKTTGYVMAALGKGIDVKGDILEGPGLRFVVVPDCTPLGPIMLLAGAILVFPATMREKLIGIALGAVILSVLNLVRMVSLVYIGLYAGQWLEVAHMVVWQSVMILAAILVFLWWMRRTLRVASA